MASPTATGLGDTPPVRVPAGHRPNRRDGAGQAARLKPRTQSGGGFGGGKGLREHDAQETVFFPTRRWSAGDCHGGGCPTGRRPVPSLP